MSEIFDQLESNNKNVVEEAKKRILDQLNIVKDPSLLNGLYDYYLSTNSAKTIVILVNIREPHYQYLFDRLNDSINNKNTKNDKNDHKVQALTLLGHIVRGQPTWLYKLSEHPLLKDILKLLKSEVEILPLISALLVLIILIPMIPYTIGEVLNDIFEIFSRLASWNCTPGRLVDDELVHLQVALYALFLRLYGMFPCNFLFYLRSQYKDKNRPVFIHTIKPMLETVKMNPSLVTTSRDNETTNERWRRMEAHDIIVECERFSLDVSDTYCAHDTCQLASGFRSRSGTNSRETNTYLQTLKNLAASMATASSNNNNNTSTGQAPVSATNEYFNPIFYNLQKTTPSTYVSPQPEFHHDDNVVPEAGSSPPEAAIEATPEITSTKEASAPMRIQSSTTIPSRSVSSSVGADEEINSIQRKNEPILMKQSDSVLQESEDSTSDNIDEDRSSPCAVGGLHMPNSQSMRHFKCRVQRLRHHSQCTADECEQDILENGIVRRVNSCPEMKKSPVSSIKDNISGILDETDEDINETESIVSNGITKPMLPPKQQQKQKQRKTSETQTYNFWPMPYEHLFLGIFPSLGTNDVTNSNQTELIEEQEKPLQPSIYDVMDKYVDNVVKCKGSDKENVKLLKSQLQLLHQQLLFERHRREIHAFKNRRFLAEAKNSQVLEEHNSALRDQVQLKQADIDNLKKQLDNILMENDKTKRTTNNSIKKLEDKINDLEINNKGILEKDKDINKDYEDLKKKYSTLIAQKQLIESRLTEALAEIKFAKEQALAGDRGLAELDFVNKQLIMIGELQTKYKERLENINSLRRSDEELNLLKEYCSNEVKVLNQRLQEKTVKLEAYVSRIEQLEQIVSQKDEIITLQKRNANIINEEIDEKFKAFDDKYQTQLIICRSLEEKILDLYRQIEIATGKPIRSPDTSSCQEVQIPSDKNSGGAGISGKSSPLSCSFASSEGSIAHFQAHHSRSIQTITDPDLISKDTDDQTNNVKFD